MPFVLRRADASARVPPRAPALDHRRVMRAFLETLARLAIDARKRELTR